MDKGGLLEEKTLRGGGAHSQPHRVEVHDAGRGLVFFPKISRVSKVPARRGQPRGRATGHVRSFFFFLRF